MFVRNILLVIGALCLLGGIALSVIWYNQMAGGTAERAPAPRLAILVATRAIPNGTLLRPADIGWKEVGAGQIRAGSLVRGQVSEAEFVGAIARRSFAAGESLVASDLIKPNERQFLSAALKPGSRAVSIAVDTPQSAAGLILPGDRVDVILTQSFEAGGNAARKSVAETVLRDVRVIAVDQTLSTTSKPPAPSARGVLSSEAAARLPKTVTFEVSDRQAEQLFVAAQLGRLHLAVRPLEVQPAETDGIAPKRAPSPTWAADVSPALSELAARPGQTNSPVESAVRRPPSRIQ